MFDKISIYIFVGERLKQKLKMCHKIVIIIISIFSFGLILNSGYAQSGDTSLSNNHIAVYTFDELEPLLYTDSNKIHVVNFWAMWCAPCIKELPIFENYATQNKNVEITLVSLDFPKDIETKLKPFLKKKGISLNVVLLDDPDANSWINKIDRNWSGAIPFTIIFNHKKRSYHERSFENIEDLKTEINNTINSK